MFYLLHGTSGGAEDWTTKGNAEQATAGLPLIVGTAEACGGFDWTDETDNPAARLFLR